MHLPVELEGVRALGIAKRVAADNGETAVIAPAIGITNLVCHGVQLDDRLLFRRVAHPRERIDVLLHRRFDFADHLQRLFFRRGAEGFLHECFAQHFPEIAVRVLDAPAPPRLQLLRASQRRPVECEVFAHKRTREHRR